MGRKTNEYRKTIDSLRNIFKNKDKFIKEVTDCTCEDVKKDLDIIFKSAIREYYKDYKPIFYRRKYALYKIYKINYKNGNLSYDFDSRYMPDVHRVKNEYIEKWMFEEGYHGGAHYKNKNIFGDISDVLLWKTPHPIIAKKNGEIPYSNFSKYKVARSTPSPAQVIEKNLNLYINGGELQNTVNRSVELILSRYGFFQ